MNSKKSKRFISIEYHNLVGKGYINLILLTSILVLTLLSISSANGGLKYLKIKMSDPYTNWVDLYLSVNIDSNEYNDLKKELLKVNVRDSFNFKHLEEYLIFTEEFWLYGSFTETQRLKGRTVSKSDPIYEKILNPGNLIYDGLNNRDDSECGIIMSLSALKKLNFTDPFSQKSVNLFYDSIFINFPISSVVIDLPNNCDFIVDPGLYNALYVSNSNDNIYTPYNAVNKIQLETYKDNLNSNYFQFLFTKYNIDLIELEKSLVKFNQNDKSFKYLVTLDKFLNEYELKGLLGLFKEEKISLSYNNNCHIPFYELLDPYYASFNFENLEKIREFRNYLAKKYNIFLESSEITNKENFSFVSKLAWFLSFGLLLLGILSIILYLNSIVGSYVEKNRHNFGTLKAFGIDNSTLKNIYVTVVIRMLLTSMFFAIIIVSVIEVVEISVMKERAIINLFDFKILLIIIMIIYICVIIFRNMVSRHIEQTPGDLIYGRL